MMTSQTANPAPVPINSFNQKLSRFARHSNAKIKGARTTSATKRSSGSLKMRLMILRSRTQDRPTHPARATERSAPTEDREEQGSCAAYAFNSAENTSRSNSTLEFRVSDKSRGSCPHIE